MASKCLTSASSTTSTSLAYEQTATAIKESTNSSVIISDNEALKVTNSRAGFVTAYPEAQDSMQSSSASQPQLKPTTGVESSDIFTMSNVSTSLSSGRDAPFVMTDKHTMLFDCIHKGNEWQQDLERVHGFTEAESCECFSRAGKYLYADEFPEGAVNTKLFPHAKEGWVHLKKVDQHCKAYPQELKDLDQRALAEGKGMWDF